ncbi:MAG: glycosyltransferase family 4 protein [Planctomycetota bacterium]|jgi:glycosyltransferase involved in cell wall biosynthesis
MHIVLIVDAGRLHTEGAMLERLVRGLAEAGTEVTAILPEAEDGSTPAFAPVDEPLACPMRVLPWMRRARRDLLVESIGRTVPDLVHAVGRRAWPIGLDLARVLERPAALEVWCAAHVRHAPRAAEPVAAYVVPTEGIADALRQRVDPALVSVVPLGVEVPDAPAAAPGDTDRPVALAVLGGARDVPSYEALLGGLSRAVADRPQLQAFVELHGPHEHEIWRSAQKLDLLGHVSALSDAADHRALLARCDALLLPERYGEVRSIMLEAMAGGMPVIAGDDPYLGLDPASDACTIVDRPDAEGWARALDRVLRDPEETRRLGEAARAWVADGHRTDDQVRGLLATFDRVLTGDTYRFEAADRG